MNPAKKQRVFYCTVTLNPKPPTPKTKGFPTPKIAQLHMMAPPVLVRCWPRPTKQ